MTIDQVRKLQPGNNIRWNDPDHGLCSRDIVVKSFTIEEGDDIISLYGQEDDYLQCFAHELTLLT
jgi:hypothetical protein